MPASANEQLKDEIRITLEKNPELIFEALKGHEERLYDLLQIGLEKRTNPKFELEELSN